MKSSSWGGKTVKPGEEYSAAPRPTRVTNQEILAHYTFNYFYRSKVVSVDAMVVDIQEFAKNVFQKEISRERALEIAKMLKESVAAFLTRLAKDVHNYGGDTSPID